MVIDEIYAKDNETGLLVSIDSCEGEMLDEIVLNGNTYHFAKQKDISASDIVECDNAVEEPFISIEAIGNTIQKPTLLPAEYQQVEYIESTGEQFINVNKPVNNFEAVVATTSSSVQYIGCFISSYTQRCQMAVSTVKITYGVGNDNYQGNYAGYDKSIGTGFHKYKITNRSFTMDGIAIGSYSVDYPTADAGGVLFGRRDTRATTTGLTNTGIMKIKSAKFYNGDTLVFDFVPCYRKSDGVIGMYDLVSGTLYTNNGTGTFLKGEDAQPSAYFPQPIQNAGDRRLPEEYQEVMYIKSTGTQYIDSGYCPSNKTKVEMAIKLDNLNNVDGADNSFCGVYGGTNCFSFNLGAGLSLHPTFYLWTNVSMAAGGTVIDCPVNDETISNKNTLILTNSTFKYGTYSRNTEKSTWTSIGVTLPIFAQRGSTGTIKPFNRYHLTMYGCRIWDDNVLVRDFVPCYRKSDGAVGMYEAIQGVFYTNNGTGTFLKGANNLYTQSGKSGMTLTVKGESSEPTTIDIPYSITSGSTTIPLRMAKKVKADSIVVDYKNGTVKYNRNIAYLKLPHAESIYNYNSGYYYGVDFGEIAEQSLSRAKGWSTHTSHVGDNPGNNVYDSFWVGVNTTIIYWIGILHTLGFNKLETKEEQLAAFNNWLDEQEAKGTPVELIYQLRTPVTKDITNTDLGQSLLALATEKGTNILTITSEIPVSQTNLSYWRQIIPNE